MISSTEIPLFISFSRYNGEKNGHSQMHADNPNA